MTFISPESALSVGLVQIGIFDEAEPLQTAVIWGAVGAEAVLAQCYPLEISLFHESFDVFAARQEGLGFAATLQSHDVEVFMVRDLLADVLKPTPLNKGAVISKMICKARDAQDQHNTRVEGFADLITALVEEDIARYGEEKALSLNKVLSINPQLPLGNSLYSRDQMNVLLETRVISRMAKDIRRREVALYESVYRKHLTPHQTIFIPQGETFEGGDAYIHNGTIFVGVGTRTTEGAAKAIYQALKPQLEESGLKFAIVKDENHNHNSNNSQPYHEQQDSMHLDTFSNPIGKRQIAVCAEEAARRKIMFITGTNGGIILSEGQSFLGYLEQTEDNVVKIPQEEQQRFGCNFLLHGEDSDGTCTIFVPLRSNTATISQLEKSGKRVVHTDLEETTKGYGAAHCMTGQLRRGQR